MANAFSGFVSADFDACKPTRRDARYLRARFEGLRQTFLSEYPEWGDARFDSYVARTIKRSGRGQPIRYRPNQWVGFALKDRQEGRPQDSVQLQASIHRNEFDAMIWLDFLAPQSARERTKRNILANLPTLTNYTRKLGDDYYVLTWNKNRDIDFEKECESFTETQLRRLSDRITESGSALYIGKAFTPRQTIKRSLGILEEIARVFRDLTPAHQLLSGKRAREGVPREGKESDSEDDLGLTERIGKGQGFFRGSSKKKKLIERTAMERAKSFFRRNWRVRDVSKRKPYDLECAKGGRRLFVEVKGTTGSGDQILLSRREVRFAKGHRSEMALFVLHSIDLRAASTSGTRLLRMPWRIDLRRLEPSGYLLSL